MKDKKITYKIGALEFLEKPEVEPKPEPPKPPKTARVPFPPCMPQRNRRLGLWFIEE